MDGRLFRTLAMVLEGSMPLLADVQLNERTNADEDNRVRTRMLSDMGGL
jgi:hypothetical protein